MDVLDGLPCPFPVTGYQIHGEADDASEEFELRLEEEDNPLNDSDDDLVDEPFHADR